MFEHLGDLKDDFLLLSSKQKNTFHVDINFYNMALKTKQTQNSIDCTQDGNASKLEAACWHFSQKKNKIYTLCVRHFSFFTRSMKLWGLFPPHSGRGRGRLVFAEQEHLGTRRSLFTRRTVCVHQNEWAARLSQIHDAEALSFLSKTETLTWRLFVSSQCFQDRVIRL